MRTSELLQQAVKARDATQCGKIAETLRFRHGMNYDAIAAFAKKHTGILKLEWETLMHEADRLEGL